MALFCLTVTDSSDSPLQLALLSLFVDLRYRFPNMVCGLLSRDSVRKALVKGLTAEQVCAARVCDGGEQNVRPLSLVRHSSDDAHLILDR